MSDILSSLYGSPSPSMMSRDPTGIDPNGVADSVRLEPTGSRADESVDGTTGIMLNGAHLSKIEVIDVAKLVGAPPPPPKTPPPKKNRRGGTPKNMSVPRGGATPRANEGYFSSFDDDSFATGAAGGLTPKSVLPPADVNEEFTVEAGEETLHVRNPAGSPDSVQIDVPPEDDEAAKKALLVEERIKMAMETYQNEEPVFGDDKVTVEENLRTAMSTLENQLPANSEQLSLNSPLKSSLNQDASSPGPMPVAASPSSEVTKPHSNQTESEAALSSSEPVLSNISESPSLEDTISPANSQDGETTSVGKKDQTMQAKTTQQGDGQRKKEEKKHKRGFLKKLFRGRKNKNSSKSRDPPEASEPSPALQASVAASPPAKPADSEPGPAGDMGRIQHEEPKSLKPALKSVEERHYQGRPLDTTPLETDDEIGVSETTGEPSADAARAPNMLSQDPPDDEHGDPPVFAGRPLSSPTSLHQQIHVTTSQEEEEETRIESVKSRIAEMYGDQPHASGLENERNTIAGVSSNLSSDRADYFFGQDEANGQPSGTDTLDSPTHTDIPIPQEPSPAHEPRTIDPHLTTTSGDDSGSLPTPAHLSRLRVHVQGPSVDPAGASPMKWDKNGHPANGGFNDPVGESPAALKNGGAASEPSDAQVSMEEADPPLTAGYLSDEDDSKGAEEKKDEEPTAAEDLTTEGLRETQDISTSKATRAALSLAKKTGVAAMKEQLSQIPTPTNGDAPSNLRVGSTPVDSAKTEVQGASKQDPSVPPRPKPTGSVDLTVDTSAEKKGFTSASNTPASAKKPLTVTAAAFTNAKAVAYLHRLHGEPSPRHSWHLSKQKPSEPSPVSKPKRQPSEKKVKQARSTPSKPSPDEYSAHNFDSSEVAETAEITPKDSLTSQTPPPSLEELHAVKTKEGAMFSAYQSKFQGRRPTRKNVPRPETPKRTPTAQEKKEPVAMAVVEQPSTMPEVILKPGKITGLAVAKGIKLRRHKRDDEVASGKSKRVLLTPRQAPEGRNRFNFVPADESEIKDPIQRAGRRLLSKAAIPIQTAARRYNAKCEAIDRMWALIVIQSYYRRWRAETNLQANVHSTVLIQSAFRGWLARDKVKEMQYSATQIQKVVRGYLSQLHTYETMYYIVRVQALMRGCYERKMKEKRDQAAVEIQRYLRGAQARSLEMRSCLVLPFQSLYRGHKVRQEYAVARASVCMIQSAWRAYSARTNFQFQIVDIVVVQSVARRWAACRYANKMKEAELFGPASIIQAQWRGYMCREAYEQNVAARNIQAAWRGFQSYTDYIFVLVDILVVQRTVRQWLARRKVNTIRQTNAAVILQKTWRRHRAENMLLYSLVHIIIAQSVARRFLSRFQVQERRIEVAEVRQEEERIHEAARLEEARKFKAAQAIQKVWRGFWGFSHYVIVQYEITRLQALVRRRLTRQAYNLKLGCAIIIQATIRRHLAKNVLERRLIAKTTTSSVALELRERNAAKRIQFWWRIVLDWMKEKRAALTIERFFVHVRQEVDREILRRERRKLVKKEQRRKKRHESEDKMLERAWLNTVDENIAVGESKGNPPGGPDLRSKSAPRLRDAPAPGGNSEQPRQQAVERRMPSPRKVAGQEVDAHGWPIHRMDSSNSRARPPTDAVRMVGSEDFSEVSNITNPSVFHRMGHPGPRHDGQHRHQKLSTDDYIKKYGGLQTAPNRLSAGQSKHFFSEDSNTPPTRRQTSGNKTTTPRMAAQNQSQGFIVTPRSSAGTPTSTRRSSSGTPRSAYSQGMKPQGAQGRAQPAPRINIGGTGPNPGTPRSNFGGQGALPVTPRSQASSHQLASPRIQIPAGQQRDRSSFPPVTPRSQMAPTTPRSQKSSGRREDKHHIARRDTAETESHTTFSHGSFSKSSPRSRPDGHIVHNGNPVMVMKTYPNFTQTHSIEEAQEVLYLGGEDLGEDFGEV